jgi:hypothetical protein
VISSRQGIKGLLAKVSGGKGGFGLGRGRRAGEETHGEGRGSLDVTRVIASVRAYVSVKGPRNDGYIGYGAFERTNAGELERYDELR